MRCPYCGSNKMYLGIKNSGYSVKKGIAGAVLFGPAGVVAGINGKDQETFICPSCGNEADSPMDSGMSATIAKALSLDDAVSLRRLKASYPNIEWNESLTKATSNTKSLENINSRKYSHSEDADVKSCLKLLISNSRRLSYEEILESRMGKHFNSEDISKALIELVECEAVTFEGGGYFLNNPDYKEKDMAAKNEEARKKAEMFIRFQELKKKKVH